MEHALATSYPVHVCATLPGEWTRARRRLYSLIYTNLLGPCPRLTLPPVPAYNIAADSYVCSHGGLTHD